MDRRDEQGVQKAAGQRGRVLIPAASCHLAGSGRVGSSGSLGVCLSAGFMLAAGGRTVSVIDQNVVVASGADHAINRFAELFMARFPCVLAARLLPAHGHRDFSLAYGFHTGELVNWYKG
jgi:hypothetical protein